MQNIDIIRLSEKQKQQLINLKRKTGIENWNVLCRWALCMSLADPTVPPKEDIPSDSNVEMTWKTFAGEKYLILYSLLIQRLKLDDTPCIHEGLKLHLNRGLSFMSKNHKIPL